MRRKILLVLLLIVVAATGHFFLRSDRPPILAQESRCRIGAYAFEAAGLAYVRQRDGETLRLIWQDGTNIRLEPDGSGRYHSSAGPVSAQFHCEEGQLELEIGGKKEVGKKLAFAEQDISFESHGIRLAGKIVSPADGVAPSSYVVLVHGSERDSAIFGNQWQYQLAAAGIGAVVYDKRGTGLSAGKYTQDFYLLADDAVAAAAELRRRVPGEYQVGALGTSQGGWIAPLAATKANLDFVVALYGLAESPLAEDRDEVLLGLAEAGFDSDEIKAKAKEITDATGKVMSSHLESGWEELAALKEKYGKESFYPHLEGEFTGTFLKYPPFGLKLVFPLFDVGTSWDYDPMPTLEKVATDHLWVLAGDDHEAPSSRTRQLLLTLQESRPKLDIAYFPRADHGILVFDKEIEGQPRTFRYAPGYRELVLEWIATRKLPEGNEGIVISAGSADSI